MCKCRLMFILSGSTDSPVWYTRTTDIEGTCSDLAFVSTDCHPRSISGLTRLLFFFLFPGDGFLVVLLLQSVAPPGG